MRNERIIRRYNSYLSRISRPEVNFSHSKHSIIVKSQRMQSAQHLCIFHATQREVAKLKEISTLAYFESRNKKPPPQRKPNASPDNYKVLIFVKLRWMKKWLKKRWISAIPFVTNYKGLSLEVLDGINLRRGSSSDR